MVQIAWDHSHHTPNESRLPQAPASLSGPHTLCPSHLSPLEVGPLLGHHLGQQLILQPVACDSEVDEGGLGLHLGLVVWVGQFALNHHAELWVVLHLLVADLDVAALLDGEPAQEVVQDRIHVLPDVL